MRQKTGGETCTGSSSDSATGLEGIRMLHCHATARGEGRNVADTRGNQAVSEDHKGADHQDEGAWVQLVIASACHAGCRRFEPRRSRQCACEFGLLYVQRSKGNMPS